MQNAFDWDRDVSLPVSGRTPSARHASATGAQVAHRRMGQKTLAYFTVLARAGSRGLTDHEAMEAMARLSVHAVGVGSITGIRSNLGAFIEHTQGHEPTAFGTKRGRYRVSAEGRAFWADRSERS